MAHIAKLRMLLFSALGPAFAVLLLVLFMGYAVFGANGLLAWGGYTTQLHDARIALAQVKAEKARLQNRVKLLDRRHIDPDMADELVRRELNVNHPDEVIVPLN
jgi:cell division protein FtsB